MARSLDLYHLINQPESLRDEGWEEAFFQAFVEAKVALANEEAQAGPDGWPYIYVKTVAAAREPVTRVLQWLSERGIGLAVNPHKMLPDYIFTYGMIWHFRETGRFLSSVSAPPGDKVVYRKGEGWIFGPPAENYLPGYVRRVLREYFRSQNLAPKVLVASSADFRQIDLLFSVESLGNPPSKDLSAIAQKIAWFLPVHYSLVMAREQNMPPFVSL